MAFDPDSDTDPDSDGAARRSLAPPV